MGDGAMIGERLPSDRRLAAVNDAIAAKQMRQDIACWLNDHGFCRPEATLDFETPCPDGDDDIEEVLIYERRTCVLATPSRNTVFIRQEWTPISHYNTSSLFIPQIISSTMY